MTNVVSHLMKLGLTEYEAKAYIAAVALGEGTIKDISEESKVPRSRAYDVMERLVQKGLVEVGSSSPRCYRANEPTIASNHLLDDMKRANEEAIKELSKIGHKAETQENPIWTVRGEWAIDHRVGEILERARSEVSILFLNNRHAIRYAKVIAEQSEMKHITVVLHHQPESFLGLLGKSRVMRIKPIPNFLESSGGVLSEKGFTTKDGKYCIEMVVHSDQNDSLMLTMEGEVRRAIIITGTILDFFSRQTIEQVVRSAEEVLPAQTSASKKKTQSGKEHH